MQVEVSKHTEGRKESTLRPNGLPESLIRYDSESLSTLPPLRAHLYNITATLFETVMPRSSFEASLSLSCCLVSQKVIIHKPSTQCESFDLIRICCDFAARLQDNAKESVGDLVGAFKNPVVPNAPPPQKAGGMSSLPVLPVEKEVGESSKPAGAKASSLTDSTRRRSTGTATVTRTDSRLSNVPESGQLGTQPGQPPRRNRRSSGFLSLLGYARVSVTGFCRRYHCPDSQMKG